VTTVEIEDRESGRLGARNRRMTTLKRAWSSLLFSKVITIATQVLAVPVAYRALGQGGFAAYASVTASANLIWALNLGIGGAMVTPVAEAIAHGDKRREVNLIHAGLVPLVLASLAGAILAIPAVFLLPLDVLFGKVGMVESPDLRIAAVVATAATLLTIPLSGGDALRQAYQEIHVGVLIGAVFNLLTCGALLVAAKRSSSLLVYVSIFTLMPLLAKAVNCGSLLSRHPYLIRGWDPVAVKANVKPLMGDGIRFLASSFSNVLVYQWPVYWMTRTQLASESSAFAVCTQLALLPVVSMMGMIRNFRDDTSIRGAYRSVVARTNDSSKLAGARSGRVVCAPGGLGGLASHDRP
jgi:O-antigen/teichoic acid export membrane protein